LQDKDFLSKNLTVKKKILVTYQIPKEGLGELFEKFDVFYPEKEMLTHDDLRELIPPYL